jgi:hypothetical protein
MDADDTNLRRGINRILFDDWDPIGVNDCAPSDKYSSHVPAVLRLLKDGASEQQIGMLLQTIATEHIGLNSKAEDNMLVAKKLRALMEDDTQAVADGDYGNICVRTDGSMFVAVETGSGNILTAWKGDDDVRFLHQLFQPRPSRPSTIATAEEYKITMILYNDWDPIGVKGMAPLDEYDSYVPSVLRLLKGGATVEQISKQLADDCKRGLGFDETTKNAQINMSVAKKLRELFD